MPVAKTFQTLKQLTEPYEKNHRKYVKVLTKSGTEREVRWYSQAEYEAMYPDEEAPVERIRSVKDVLGFTDGFITIFKGDIEPVEFWFEEQEACRYHVLWGWYVISTEEVPTLPAGVTAVRLPWEEISEPDGSLKSESAIIKVVESLIYADDTSQYLGEVGERKEFTLTVDKTISLEDAFGTKTLHIFVDPDGNVATWTTAAKTLVVGSTHHLRGTIQSLDTYKGTKQTRLTRCTIL